MKAKKILISVIVAAVSMFGTNAYSVILQDDNVLSQHLKEADGTSGQNTNTGSGVKTDHIQNSAVTDSKLANGAVTTSKIADGSVTDAKITGPISVAKIESNGLNADTVDGIHASSFAPTVHSHNQADVNGLDTALSGKANMNHSHPEFAPILHGHNQTDVAGLTNALAGKADAAHDHDALYQKKFGSVAVVAKSGGEYTDPVTAMNELASWCGMPSANNPCLLKIMPGVYDIGVNTLGMQPHVDLEGSGERNTVIIGGIIAEGYLEIRSLSVQNTGSGSAIAIRNGTKVTNVTANITGPGTENSGIYIYRYSSVMLANVTVSASGGSENYGIFFDVGSLGTLNNVNASASNGNVAHGIFFMRQNEGSALTNVTATATNAVAENYGVTGSSFLELTGVTAKASGGYYSNFGVFNVFTTMKINRSSIGGVKNWGTVYVGNSEIDWVQNSGIAICAGVYDQNYTFYPNSCP